MWRRSTSISFDNVAYIKGNLEEDLSQLLHQAIPGYFLWGFFKESHHSVKDLAIKPAYNQQWTLEEN